VQHVTEIADSITAAGSSGDESAGDESASGDDAVGLIPMPIKVIKTDKLIGCLRTPQVRPNMSWCSTIQACCYLCVCPWHETVTDNPNK
jgi:hypothetical protein